MAREVIKEDIAKIVTILSLRCTHIKTRIPHTTAFTKTYGIGHRSFDSIISIALLVWIGTNIVNEQPTAFIMNIKIKRR